MKLADAPGPTPTQEKALQALAAGRSVTDAAAAAGVDRSTVHRWLKRDAKFIAALNQHRADRAAEFQVELQSLRVEATRTIRALMTAESTPALVRLKAAEAVLALAAEPVGPTDADEIRDDWAREREAREYMRQFENLGLPLS